MRQVLPILLVSTVLVSAPVWSSDFLDQPKAVCSYFAELGMKAQFQWGPAPQGGAYLCQYADEFSGNTRFVRGARVYVDPASETVGMGLSIQGFAVHQADAVELLSAFVGALYQSRNRPLPPGLSEVIHAVAESAVDGEMAVTGTDPELWEKQKVIGLSWVRTVGADQLAALETTVTPEESTERAETRVELETRCRDAVFASDYAQEGDRLEMSSKQLSASRYHVTFSGDQGEFSCQVCDDSDPAVNCGTMGARLTFTGLDGLQLHLPAELDRKCLYSLQKEVSTLRDGSFIDHELVERVTTREIANDSRYVFEHDLDGSRYRCVIRKRDLSFRVERSVGDDQWRTIAAGIKL